jgi:hypothetical protein
MNHMNMVLHIHSEERVYLPTPFELPLMDEGDDHSVTWGEGRRPPAFATPARGACCHAMHKRRSEEDVAVIAHDDGASVTLRALTEFILRWRG